MPAGEQNDANSGETWNGMWEDTSEDERSHPTDARHPPPLVHELTSDGEGSSSASEINTKLEQTTLHQVGDSTDVTSAILRAEYTDERQYGGNAHIGTDSDIGGPPESIIWAVMEGRSGAETEEDLNEAPIAASSSSSSVQLPSLQCTRIPGASQYSVSQEETANDSRVPDDNDKSGALPPVIGAEISKDMLRLLYPRSRLMYLLERKFDVATRNEDVVNELLEGFYVELEHGTQFENEVGHLTNVTEDSLEDTFRIAFAHNLEVPDYYRRLEAMERQAQAEWTEWLSAPDGEHEDKKAMKRAWDDVHKQAAQGFTLRRHRRKR